MAQFGSALGLGPRGRRFKSSHPDMQNTLLVVAAMLLLTNAATMYYAYRLRNRLLEEEKTLEGCASSIRSLEREIFE